MALRDRLIKDLDTFFNENDFAIEIVYNSTPILAIVNYLETPKFDGQDTSDKISVMVKRSDVSYPKYNDSIIIDSVIWKVVGSILGQDGLLWKIDAENNERIRFSI